MRQPLAMKTLIRQIVRRKGDATLETANPDGLGVLRTLRVGDATSEWLVDNHAESIASDLRVDSLELDEDGVLSIHFVLNSSADDAAPFRLAREEPAPVAVELSPDGPEYVDEGVAERDVREQELKATPVADLRKTHGYPKSAKKADIVADLLALEFD
jgi:hypothetical protein